MVKAHVDHTYNFIFSVGTARQRSVAFDNFLDSDVIHFCSIFQCVTLDLVCEFYVHFLWDYV